MVRSCRRKQVNKGNRSVIDNGGFTLVEMVTTFALLGIFLVAVTRMISYTVTLYHETQGAALGMQVNDMIAARIRGVIEDSTLIVTDYNYLYSLQDEERTNLEGNGFDKGFLVGGDDHILLKDGNEVAVEISVDEDGSAVIKYNEIPGEYDVHEWKFDEKAYMGYKIKDISFAMAESKGTYEPNVVYMRLTIESTKYGEYTSEYYIRAPKYDPYSGWT